jgi:hypothetical protein
MGCALRIEAWSAGGGAYIISSRSPVLLVEDGGMITIVLTHALRALGFSELERKGRDPATGGSIKIRAGKRVVLGFA